MEKFRPTSLQNIRSPFAIYCTSALALGLVANTLRSSRRKFHKTLDYHSHETLVRYQSSQRSFWTFFSFFFKEENHINVFSLKDEPHLSFEVPSDVEIHIIRNEDQCERLLHHFMTQRFDKNSMPVFGFDSEWKPNSTNQSNKIALLQLSDGKHCLLFHLAHFKRIPKSLVDFLTNPNIIKAGVGIFSDIKKLHSDYGIDMRGYVDLQALAHRYNHTESGTGLHTLAKVLLDINVDKNHRIRCSNWEVPNLSRRQIAYASVDAWVCRELFLKLHELHGKQTSFAEFIHGLIDVKKVINIKQKSAPSAPNPDREKKKAESSNRYTERKEPLYQNCRMLAPDGTLLCTCDKKKVNWYLERNIAELVSEDPITIRLKFQPNGKGHAGDAYYLTEKANQCVICGNSEKLVRHWVVPHSYRIFFPEEIKSRSSHDIVLVCTHCSESASVSAHRFKNQIANEYQIPLDGVGKKFEVEKSANRIKGIASALKKTSLPPERATQLKGELRRLLQLEDDVEITEEIINNAASMETKKENPNFQSHEELVIDQLKGDLSKLEIFVRRWRENFLDSMKPKFMPAHWSPYRGLT